MKGVLRGRLVKQIAGMAKRYGTEIRIARKGGAGSPVQVAGDRVKFQASSDGWRWLKAVIGQLMAGPPPA